MGLYDIVKVPVKCPYCGAIVPEGQTKDLARFLFTYKTGDYASEKLKYLNTTYLCRHSLRCIADSLAMSKDDDSLVGMLFDAKIMLDDNGVITGEYETQVNEEFVKFVNAGEIEKALEYIQRHPNLFHELRREDKEWIKKHRPDVYRRIVISTL